MYKILFGDYINTEKKQNLNIPMYLLKFSLDSKLTKIWINKKKIAINVQRNVWLVVVYIYSWDHKLSVKQVYVLNLFTAKTFGTRVWVVDIMTVTEWRLLKEMHQFEFICSSAVHSIDGYSFWYRKF